MITVDNVGLSFDGQKLYEGVNIKFTPGNCYGIIGANGAGKSTFLRILSGTLAPSKGTVSMAPTDRMATLNQNHYAFEEHTVMDTVIMGYKKLYDIMKEKDAIYEKPDFSDEDGIRAGELEGEFAELDGWSAESDASQLLDSLGISKEKHFVMMSELEEKDKVKVLLAQAIFRTPDILLLDEPTNGLDIQSIEWLCEFIIDFPNTVIVVSHDRYFLNRVCTYICDVDFGQIKLFVGNYDFWKQSSELATRLAAKQNAAKEEKIKELEAFIARFSANASKSKQATSRKKMLDKITLDDITPTSRKYPFVGFTPERLLGKDVLQVENVSKTIDGVKLLDNVSFMLSNEDKVAFLADNVNSITTLFRILVGELEPDTGSVKWGVTTTQSYMPTDNSKYFDDTKYSIIDWLRQYAKPEEQDNITMRGLLGKMLFSGEEVNKPASVLSGGEKVRCMLSKTMLSGANVLLMDDPTNHLDLESISSLNDGLAAFKGVLLFSSHDHEFIQTIANRIIYLTPNGMIDEVATTYEEFLDSPGAQARVKALQG